MRPPAAMASQRLSGRPLARAAFANEAEDASEEQRTAALAASHDCCRMSLLVVRVGLSHVALARVIRLKLLTGTGAAAAGSIPNSFALEPGSTKQAFQLELLYPEAVSMPVGE